jgi:ornithine cyclodeaminase
VITATAAREALVMSDEVAPGTHISAMGADGVGKQELDPALVARARLFADYPEQSVRLGEFQHAVGAGLVGPDAIVALGQVLAGKAQGRTSAEEITVFDSSGISLQDLLVAQAIVAAATAEGLAQQVEF